MMLKTGAAHGNGSRPLADESTPAEASSEEPHAEEVTSPVHRPAETLIRLEMHGLDRAQHSEIL